MAVLITGGAGYVGSAIVHRLTSAGIATVVLDDLRKGHPEALPPAVPLFKGDIANPTLLRDILRRHQVDAVIHCAALAEVAESVRDPRRYYRNNVEKGIAFLAGLIDSPVRRLVFSSSCSVYGEPQNLPLDEQHPLVPSHPYGRTKQMFEWVLADFALAHGLRSLSLRYFNAAGALPAAGLGEDHQPESHLIPNLLRGALNGSEVVIHGGDFPTRDGTCERDYLHIEDLAEAHLLALEALDTGYAGGALNLGRGQGGATNLEVARTVEAVTGEQLRLRIGPRRPGDPPALVADASRAQLELGWTPRRTALEDIIASAWKWHQSHPQGYRTGASLEMPPKRAEV
jgi:UDP-glucose-4-epimerase GalE